MSKPRQFQLFSVRDQSLFITFGEVEDSVCVTMKLTWFPPPPLPIRLCHILVTPSPPSLEVKWQSIFYSPPFMLCYIVLQLIPLRSPSKTIQSPPWEKSFSPQAMNNDWFLVAHRERLTPVVDTFLSFWGCLGKRAACDWSWSMFIKTIFLERFRLQLSVYSTASLMRGKGSPTRGQQK